MNQRFKSDPTIDVLFEGTEPERVHAIQRSAANLVARMTAATKEDCVWNLAEAVWPALMMPEYDGVPVERVSLRLVPLSRIGQMEGKSGSLVLIGFLADAEDDERPHSHPVVIKTLSVENRDKLREEYENALSIKPFAYDQKDNLAIPILLDSDQAGFNVLWSIFSPSDPIWPLGVSGKSPDVLKVRDLRAPLELGDNASAQPILSTTFRLLSNLHHRLSKSQVDDRLVCKEYERYLRRLDEGVWGREWKETWGTSDVQHVEDAGGRFTNPFWVLERLRKVQKSMYIGAVHGDLHPGNIVLADGQPRIIDFGWAQDRAHIATDFVLMECNLRFHTVRPQLSQRDVYALCGWFEWGRPIPDALEGYARGRAKLIEHVREIANQTFPTETEWDWEYIVPLFLVSFGLLRFAPQLGNQQAAVRFVLALASHVDQLLQEE